MKKMLTVIIIGVLFLSMFSIFAPHVKATGLPPVGYWKFDEGAGNTASDSSGNGNDGTIYGASWTSGISSGALRFDGADDHVNVPNSASLAVSGNQISVGLWMKPAVTLDATTPLTLLLDKGDEYGFQMDPTSSGGRIWFFVWLASAPWQGITTTTDRWEANTWYYLIGTYDGSYLRVYVNGVLENSRPLSGDLYRSGFPLSIGSYCLGTMCFFNGAIDEVKIYNYARTAEDIWNEYSSYMGPRTTLTINVFDESGFPPASIHGVNRIANMPIRIYTLDDTLVASGSTDASGTASFNLANGQYKIVYGSKVIEHFGVASKIVDVSGGSMNLDLYSFQAQFHTYSGGGPYELDHIDLDKNSAGYQDAITVQPGQQVNAEFSWWELETVNVPVWYVSAFGSWNPTSALGNLASGCASPSSHNLHTVPLTFTAPSTPGTYEVRLVGVLDYTWPNSFYTASHYQPALGRDTGIAIIGKTIDGPYGIATIAVSSEVGEKPVAILHLDDPVHNIGADVWFYGDQSYDPDGGGITSYIFDFDDQTPYEQVYWPQIGTTHQYSAAGEYWPRMKVLDDEGMESDWITAELIILPAPGFPEAILVVSPNPQKVGEPVTFDASQSSDAGGWIVDYGFDFGDGTSIIWTSAPTVTHSYLQVGDYYARVCVSDNTGLETWSIKQRIIIRNEEPPQQRTLRVAIQSDPPVRVGTIPFAVTFTAIPSGGRGSYRIAWLVESSVGGAWSSTENPLTFNFKYSDTYTVMATATCSGTSEVATAQTTILAIGIIYEAKFTLWSGIVQPGTNDPLVSLEYNNVKNLGYFTVSGASVSLKTGVRVSFNGGGNLPDWLFDLIGISAPWYSIRVSDSAGTIDAVPLVQLKAGSATPIDVTLPLGTPTKIEWGYMFNFSASPTSVRAICADLVSCVFAALSLNVEKEPVLKTIFMAIVEHLDETMGAQLVGLPFMSAEDQLSLIQTVINDVLTPGYLVSLAASVGGGLGRSLLTRALARWPSQTIAAALVLSDLALFFGAIYRGDLWDQYYVSQSTPMLYACIDPPEIINAVLDTPYGAVGYLDGMWLDGGNLAGFYHSEILNNTYGFGIPITASEYSASLTISSPSGNIIPYDIIFNWMGNTSEFQGEVSGEAHVFAVQVSEADIHVYLVTETDINPNHLNLRSEGKWITTYIELPESFDVSAINASSILLNGTIPVDTAAPVTIGDYDNDGIPDLMVKFDRATVESWIYNTQGIRYGNVALTITGELLDGTPFKGTDVISVNYAGDANNDGVINIFDILAVKSRWAATPDSPSWVPEYDVNGDEAINVFDVLVIRSNWEQTTP